MQSTLETLHQIQCNSLPPTVSPYSESTKESSLRNYPANTLPGQSTMLMDSRKNSNKQGSGARKWSSNTALATKSLGRCNPQSLSTTCQRKHPKSLSNHPVVTIRCPTRDSDHHSPTASQAAPSASWAQRLIDCCID